MDNLEKYELVNKCETIEELESAVKALAGEDGLIQGRTRKFDANKMASYVGSVVKGLGPINVLTREFGIRQQALYLKFYQRD